MSSWSTSGTYIVQIAYDLPLPEVLEQQEGEEWLCLAKEIFMWMDDDFVCPVANPTYSTRHTPKGEDAIGKRVRSLACLSWIRLQCMPVLDPLSIISSRCT
jgi:hypothetical protein